MDEDDSEANLRLSCNHVGQLYPVLIDKHGNVIDGKHRLAVDKDWPKMALDHIDTQKKMLLARLVSNVCRRTVSNGEKTKMLTELGEIHLKEGIAPGRIAQEIAEETGMSYRWVMKYLPDNLKERPGLGGPSRSLDIYKSNENLYKSKVAFPATATAAFLLLKPERKVLTIKEYTNTSFVHIMLEKKFYAKIEKVAEDLGTTPDTTINNVFLWLIKTLEDAVSPALPSCK
jgi:hypothetical protein